MVIRLEDLRKNESLLCGSFMKLVAEAKALSSDPSEQQVILTQMVLKDLMMNKIKPEAAFPLGFPKKKRSGSRGMPKQSQKSTRIIIKFKLCVSETTGIASYSCSVSHKPGLVVNPNPINVDEKQDLKLRLKCKKRCYSEIGQVGSEGLGFPFHRKRLRNGKEH